MKEIRFRGKRKDNEKWIYGNLISRKNNKHQEEIGEYTCCIIEDSDKVAYRTFASDYLDYRGCKVDPETIGQFVGLLDKYGKEIYVGDILRVASDGMIFIKHGRTAFLAYRKSNGRVINWDSTTRGEIIGNKFESPELWEE